MATEGDRASPFDLVGNKDTGVVCIHGFTGTPYEVRYLGEKLAGAGYDVHGVLLPGHGTRVEDLDATTWHDWADAVEDAFDTMRMLYGRVALVGQSLGGLLALHLAARRPEVAAVATLAAPLWLDGLGKHVAKWSFEGSLQRMLPRLRAVPKLGGSDVRDRIVRAENPCYRSIPVRALGELVSFMREVDAALPQIAQPVLVLHGAQDHTAPVGCAYHIAQRARAVRTRILPRSYHLIAVDVERDIVAAEVIDFLRQHVTTNALHGDLPCAT